MNINQIGRSMVEMLGVLAIIGILSIGAIAGYQKATMKYKLNKQSQQLTQLLTSLHRYKAEWNFGQLQFVDLIPYYKKLGEIPQEMIKNIKSQDVIKDDKFKNHEVIFDVFHSSIQMRTNMCDPICTEVMLVYYINKQNSFDICKNLAIIGKELRNNIKMLNSGKMTSSSSSTTYGPRYYGDEYCTKDVDCLAELTLDDIYAQCEYCTDSNAHCSYYFRFDMT